MAEKRIAAVDTEGSVEHPWCLTISTRPRHSVLVRATDTVGLQCVQRVLDEADYIVCHYWPHDARVLNAMGVYPDTQKALDTMQLAYIAGRLPQGLKTLGYRLCNMRMGDYSDMIAPHEARISGEYLKRLEALYAPQHLKDKKHPVYKAIQRCWKSKRGARALWMDQQPEILEAARRSAAEGWIAEPAMPEATLNDVPFSEVLPYACADADATRRVFLKLRELFS